MCHSDESRPPAPPRQGEVGVHGDLRLTASDGNSLLAYEAHPAAPSTKAIVILPDIRGLHHYYKHLSERFAEAGFHAVAFDWFGRTADSDDRAEGFDWQTHIPQTTQPGIAADVAACIEKLRADGAESVFTVGFCFGGRNSYRQAADQPGLTGAIGFYGSVDTVGPVADQVQAPILMLLAGADHSIAPESFRRPHRRADRAWCRRRAACVRRRSALVLRPQLRRPRRGLRRRVDPRPRLHRPPLRLSRLAAVMAGFVRLYWMKVAFISHAVPR